ncbi:hypothetical protein EMIHUDRAFT_55475, partial [Emiliania huxleyi CCMP1516]|uniref:Protein kinase domain-containing protein n=2 Tax=Emiliania huxleyi TaxID=2903 RepID=A0A0D3KIQ5_EMIH1
PFVVRSRGWLCGERLCALLLDYLPGGSLGALLRRTGPLGQRAARFYVGQAALGLAHLHERRVGHRDLKPDNLCLSSAGHCTLGQGQGEGEGEGRSFSLLGTPDYLAPEMFLREGHGPRVDLWALGATLYELLLDALPFGSGGDPTATYAAALRGAPHFPASPFLFCAAAKDLVMALLSRDPTARPSPSALLQHPFFGAGAFPK